MNFKIAMLAAGLAACAVSSSSDDVQRSMKQYELAVGLHAEGNDAAAFKTLFTALETDPDNSRAHLLLASLYLVRREENPKASDEKAEHHFDEVLRIEAARETPSRGMIADAHNSLGVLRMHQLRYDDAIKHFEFAIEEDLYNAKAYMAWGNLGWAQKERGNPDKALDALRRAVKINPKFCVGHYRLGQVLVDTKAFEDADAALTNAIEAHDNCAGFQDAWHARGQVRMNLGHRDDARQDFERCVELQPQTEAGQACRRYLEATY